MTLGREPDRVDAEVGMTPADVAMELSRPACSVGVLGRGPAAHLRSGAACASYWSRCVHAPAGHCGRLEPADPSRSCCPADTAAWGRCTVEAGGRGGVAAQPQAVATDGGRGRVVWVGRHLASHRWRHAAARDLGRERGLPARGHGLKRSRPHFLTADMPLHASLLLTPMATNNASYWSETEADGADVRC